MRASTAYTLTLLMRSSTTNDTKKALPKQSFLYIFGTPYSLWFGHPS